MPLYHVHVVKDAKLLIQELSNFLMLNLRSVMPNDSLVA